MSCDLTRKLDLVPLFALPCIFVAVVLESIIGTELSTILGMTGGTSLIAWFVRRNSEFESPRNIATRKYLNIGLVLLGLGTLFLSLGAGENILSSSGSAGNPNQNSRDRDSRIRGRGHDTRIRVDTSEA